MTHAKIRNVIITLIAVLIFGILVISGIHFLYILPKQNTEMLSLEKQKLQKENLQTSSTLTPKKIAELDAIAKANGLAPDSESKISNVVKVGNLNIDTTNSQDVSVLIPKTQSKSLDFKKVIDCHIYVNTSLNSLGSLFSKENYKISAYRVKQIPSLKEVFYGLAYEAPTMLNVDGETIELKKVYEDEKTITLVAAPMSNRIVMYGINKETHILSESTHDYLLDDRSQQEMGLCEVATSYIE